MRIKTERLIKLLESVQAGIHLKETVAQSSCFVFQNKRIMTFNEEILCIRKTELDFEGAVKANNLLPILAKLTEEELDLVPYPKKGELVIRGAKGKSMGIPMESDIDLPIGMVEPREGKEWRRLPAGFMEACELANQCCSSDESMFKFSCVHIHPNWIEGCDEWALCRSELETTIDQPTLVRHQSMKQICDRGMTKFMETDNWLHFRNPEGLILATRRHLEDYYELSHMLDVEGSKVFLPKGLRDATDNAEIFSKENPENQKVMITLMPGKMRIKGQGDFGWYREPVKVKYKGKKLRFLIAPKLLIDLVEKHNEAIINAKHLFIDGSTFKFVTALENPNGDDNGKSRNSRKEDRSDSEDE